ncbi:MAG: RNA polymerase subunit sigma [Gemmataceae bacterium]|nr:RNA polymerase subunit sigma [Gemmataceae bacterium]
MTQANVTTLLDAAREGDPDAAWRALALIHERMRRAAGYLMRGERAEHTWQPTALVNEAALRLLGSEALKQAQDGPGLVLAATRAMRQLLVDHARARGRLKRGGVGKRLALDSVPDVAAPGEGDLALQEALGDLARLSPRQADVVTLRFFGGLSVPEAAEALGVSVSTVEADYRVARAWLRQRLGGEA